jgi:hypothetical protein
MAKKKQVHLTVSSTPELNAALRAAAEARGLQLGEFVRRTLARAIKRPDLAQQIRMGRPQKIETDLDDAE